MPAYVTTTIIWAFVLAFLACLAGGVLMIFGFWEPKDPAVRKWLLSGVVISVVGVVVGFGTQQFEPKPAEPERPPVTTPQEKPGASAQPATQPTPTAPKDEPQPPSSDDDTPRKPDTTAPPSIPADVKQWAEKELGPRPVLSPTAADYPDCVRQLRNAYAAEADPSDAQDCKRDLQKFHMDVVVAYYDVKRPYDRNLEREESALRKGSVEPAELARYNYIIAEMDRLNTGDNPEEDTVHALEERLLGDIRRCAKSQCR